MLQVRVSDRGGPWLQRLGPAIARALLEHPLAPCLDAIALIGAGDPLLVRPGDPALRVIVPLLGEERPDALARWQLDNANALVLLDGAESRIGARAVPCVVVGGSATAPRFLPTASSFDELQAGVALAGFPDLRGCLEMARGGVLDMTIPPARIADAVIEAVIVAGRTRD